MHAAVGVVWLSTCLTSKVSQQICTVCLPRVSSPFLRAGGLISAPSSGLSALQSICLTNYLSAWRFHSTCMTRSLACHCQPALSTVLCVCLSTCLAIRLSTAMCSCLSFTLPSPPTFHKSFYPSIQKVLHLLVNLLINKTTFLSAGLSERLPSCPKCPFICLSTCLWITCLYIHVHVHPPVRLHVHLPVQWFMPCFPNYTCLPCWPTNCQSNYCTMYIDIIVHIHQSFLLHFRQSPFLRPESEFLNF